VVRFNNSYSIRHFTGERALNSLHFLTAASAGFLRTHLLPKNRSTPYVRPPGRGDFCFGDFTHAPSPKNLPKNGFCPKKGVAFLTPDVLEKKVSGAGEDSAVGASASTYGSAATGRGNEG
jgi:hypothetical protein